ncbi:DUF5946 family protein [Gracilibacillus marinus]|jgi:hypothetical protein|uniref:DUF5946 family protein n=1 Tax=Gracilibacillus marinus TaxID=630535 RepID=A0ABV8VXQ8_9BACI
MPNHYTVMESGRCIECGAREIDGYSCYQLFEFPLVWEHNDAKLYELHFWLVSCYMIQHPSNFTEEGYDHLVNLFKDAYDNNWDTSYILKKNREIVKSVNKITNAIPIEDRKRQKRIWSMTIEDIYLGGELNAIENINKWRDNVRNEWN